MRLIDFDFSLPPELIAQYPCLPRSASRLLCLDKTTGGIKHKCFNELPELLSPNDLLVFNDTKVIPARLFGKKITGGKIEILVERILTENRVLAHIRSNKKLKIGLVITFDEGYQAEISQRHNDLFELVFHSYEPVLAILEKIGHIPLPPYINRSDESFDESCYQTVYAKNKGAVAAPTAGLHFDEQLLTKIREKGIAIGFITLHVGSGTFQPIRAENINEHKMHAEYLEVSECLCEQVEKAKQKGGRVIAVGTTSVRSLETASKDGRLSPFQGYTDIFICPGYSFRCVDAVVTNFHLPKSTLLLLVCAFAGYENIIHAYEEAIAKSYRFFSYGDAMFIA